MQIYDFISVALISSGGLIISVAVFHARKILRMLVEKHYISQWKKLIVLMIFFITAYLFSAYLILAGNGDILEYITSVVFFFGALFVFLVIRISMLSIGELVETSFAKEEKETLLKEIHHRVKNNMQIVSSLLNLQMTSLKDEESRKLFKECQSRIQSMAFIHEKLYRSKDLERIDFSEYLVTLTESIYQTYGVNREKVKFLIHAENIYLDLYHAIPCGLIVNELISNSLKYAFTGNKQGEVSVSLAQQNGGSPRGSYRLTVEDNGVGFPGDLNLHGVSTLGLQLVFNLAEQLDGKINIDKKHKGAKVILEFRVSENEAQWVKK